LEDPKKHKAGANFDKPSERKPKRPPSPKISGKEVDDTPKQERKPAEPHQPADKMDKAFYRVCAPCSEVDCSKKVASEADICCPVTQPAPKRLSILVIVLIVLAVLVCLSFVSMVVFFFMRYRRIKREMDKIRLYNEQAVVQGYQRPAPVPVHDYQPGAAMVRVQPTQQPVG